MIRFSHTVFALPFAGLACALAFALPFNHSLLDPGTIVVRLVGVLVCMVSARSAAMAFNRLVDATLDAENPRTVGRHLPAGQLTRIQVWTFFAASVVAFLLACLLFLPNWLPIAFAIPVLFWICGYSFAKRITSAAHVWLGTALALSPVCAWVAIRGEEVMANVNDILPASVLAIAIACWVAGFDIIYACQDAEYDRRAKLHSIPARFGLVCALRLSASLHLAMLLVLASVPLLFPALSLAGLYWAAWSVVCVLVIRQHVIVRPDRSGQINLGRINEAFFQINAIISLGFSSIAAIDSWLR